MKIQKQFVTAIAVLILGSIFLSEASLMLFDQPLEETYEEREEKRDSLEKEEELNSSRKFTTDKGNDYISNALFEKLNSDRGIRSIIIEFSHSVFSSRNLPLFLVHCSFKIYFC